MKAKWLFLSLAAAAALSSCTLQKRSFNSGYYVDWNRAGDQQQTVKEQSHLQETPFTVQENLQPVENKVVTASEDTNKTKILSPSVTEKKVPAIPLSDSIQYFQEQLLHLSAQGGGISFAKHTTGDPCVDACADACVDFVFEAIWDSLSENGKIIFSIVIILLFVAAVIVALSYG